MAEDFPKKCHMCGMTRKSRMDRPCLNKLKEPIAQAEKDKIEENCPAVCIMYA